MKRAKACVIMTLVTMAPFAAGLALRASDTVTIRGQVIDAACYMMHPQAASLLSHQDCAAACLKRGVPLAIANEADGRLYFPADSKPLAGLLGQRVEAVGSVVDKAEPLELKMPVGDANQMSVRVDGGYKVVTIEKLTKLAAAAKKKAKKS